MKVTLYGDNQPGSGAWCYAESLKELGHDVQVFSGAKFYGGHRGSLISRLQRKLFGLDESARMSHVDELLRSLRKFQPAILIVLKGLLLSGSDIRNIRKLGIWVCNINHDDFFSLNKNNWSRIQRAAIPFYDFIFTTREVNVSEINPLNSRVEYLPFSYYPRIHRKVKCSPEDLLEFTCDVVFVGTYERERAKMLEALVKRMEINLMIHGSQWYKLSPFSSLRKCVKSRGLGYNDMAKALGAARISLGFLRKENRDDYTQRTFEIPACGGVLLAERTPTHLELFTEGRDAEFFENANLDELQTKISLLLEDSLHREKIRRQGERVILRGDYTYVSRLQRLLKVYAQTL